MARTSKLEVQRKAQAHKEMMDASADEINRFNQALNNGAYVTINTFCGEYVVTMVDTEFMYHTYLSGSKAVRPYEVGSRQWAGGNDSQWAGCLRQAGVERNALWAQR